MKTIWVVYKRRIEENYNFTPYVIFFGKEEVNRWLLNILNSRFFEMYDVCIIKREVEDVDDYMDEVMDFELVEVSCEELKNSQSVEPERIRRITGYLTGGLNSWNSAKRAEERDRVKHTGVGSIEP